MQVFLYDIRNKSIEILLLSSKGCKQGYQIMTPELLFSRCFPTVVQRKQDKFPAFRVLL
jgi:hypothetical protein